MKIGDIVEDIDEVQYEILEVFKENVRAKYRFEEGIEIIPIEELEKVPLTKVIFRQWKDVGIIALFPEEPTSVPNWFLCGSYMHIGQHGSANPDLVLKQTKLAKNYEDLKQELEHIGYVLDVRKRISPQMREKRQLEWERGIKIEPRRTSIVSG